jgi:hypothetical protein
MGTSWNVQSEVLPWQLQHFNVQELFYFNIPCPRLEYFYLKRFYNFPSRKFLVYWKKYFFPKFQHFWNNVISVETWSLHMQNYTWIHMLRSCMSKFYICMCWSIHTQLYECILYHVYKLCVNGCTGWSLQSEVLPGNCNISILNGYFILKILCQK